MANRTEKDLWIEMTIREIWTQANLAELAYRNLALRAGTDASFSFIHAFLTHCANVSEMLAAGDGENPPKTIGEVLEVSNGSYIHSRIFRNHLAHFDKRVREWICNKGTKAVAGATSVAPKSKLMIPGKSLVSHYDPANKIFTFMDEDFNISALYDEVIKVKWQADIWVKNAG
ncbi:MAG: hypothetical protein AABZ23_04835 [Deltaproteobacteria bacterium]